MSLIVKPGQIDAIDEKIGVGDSESHKNARHLGYSAILNLAKEVNYEPPEGVEYRKVPLTDDGNNRCSRIEEAVEALDELVKEGKKVLVHCRSGVSRSPSIVAAYFEQHEGWTLDSAIQAIKQKRPIVNPGVGFWGTLLLCSMQESA